MDMIRLNNKWKNTKVLGATLAFIIGYLLGCYIQSAHAVADINALRCQGADTLGNPMQTITTGQSNPNSLQTPKTQSTTAANGIMTVSIAALAGKTTYISGMVITGSGATAASVITVTITNTVTQTMNYNIVIPAGVTTTITPLVVSFVPSIPANAVNTIITVTVPAFGAGNTNAAVSIWGFIE